MKNKIKENKNTYILLFWIVIISLLALRFISTGYDYWWHIKAGEYMINNHTILNHDVFSWFAMSSNLSWIAHEWLIEIFLYILKLLFGKYHIFIYCGGLFFAILTILFITNRKQFLNHMYLSIIYLLCSLVFVGYTLFPRPQMIGYLFFVLTCYLLFDLSRNEESKKIYFLPLITIIWSNTHGGSSNLSYILCFVFFFIGNFNFHLGKLEAKPYTKKQLKKYLVVMLLCIIAIMINPFGINLLWYPYKNMQDSFMLKTISEWQPSNPNYLNHLFIFGFLGIIIWILLTSDKKVKLLDLLLCAMFGFLALKSIRFWPYIYFISAFFLFDYIKSQSISNEISKLILVFSIVLFIFAIPKHNLANNIMKPVIDESFITKIKEINPKRLYNYYDYGGYLIYRDIPVFIDGRADLYSKYNYRNSYYLNHLQGDFSHILDYYQFDLLILDRGIPLSFYLKQSNQYELILEKDNTVLYQKK